MKKTAPRGQKKRSIESLLLMAITRAQSQFVLSRDARTVFEGMLDALLHLTESEYGFIGEVFHEEDGTPFLKTHAITNIAWNEETQRLYDENIEQGLEFRNLETLFGNVLTTGSVVIANEPASDERRGGVPQGHPPLNAFLGLPFFHRDKMIGMVGIANREQGYDQGLVDVLQPFLTTCTNIILGVRSRFSQEAIERSLRESEARGRAILNTTVDAIITIDHAGRIESCNRAASQIFGYGTNELVSMNVKELMPTGHSERHDAYINDYMQTGRARIIGVGRELIAKRRDGSEFPIELTVNEIKLEGRRLFVGMLRDISERRANEAQRDKLTKELTHRVEELDRLNEENGLLSGLGSYLQACSTKEEAYDVLLAHVRVLFSNESGAFYTLGEATNATCVLSWGDEQEILLHPVQKQDCWAMRRGVVHKTSDTGATLRCRHYNGMGAGSQFCIPVMTQNGPIGLLTLHMPSDDDEDELEQRVARSLSLMTGIADRLGPALSGIELRARLHEDSIRDPLTKLYNRRFMNESVHREMLRARRADTPLSFIILDLDRFKHINDEYGHDIGDEVLIMVAQSLSQAVREEDFVYRYGGEEFVIVLPGANLDIARERAQEACRTVRALRIDTQKGPLHVTISAGVATYPEHGQTQENLIVQADKALYLAKQSGRDRIELAGAAAAS
jgi:diguanylate cyclase (GGDEF)-like protein/PAS domain S-box-containing protein